MLKEEFESRIGKEVDYTTYELYNKMYNAIDLDKDAFCALLDKGAIKESERAVQARQDRERMQAQGREIIAECKSNIADYQEDIKRNKFYMNGTTDVEWQLECKYNISIAKYRIEQERKKIAETRLIYGL